MFTTKVAASLYALALAFVLTSAECESSAQQTTLTVPTPSNPELNFTKLFTNELIFHDTWSKDSWNGLTTFAKATPLRCFGRDAATLYDVAVLGAPFDIATSYRPGARFGPNGIRQGSRRLGIDRINVPMKIRASDYLDIVDCGDVPMVYIDNKVALRQLEFANKALLARPTSRSATGKSLAKDGKFHL